MNRTWLVLCCALVAAALAGYVLFGADAKRPSAEETLAAAAERERLGKREDTPLPGATLQAAEKPPEHKGPKPPTGPRGSVDVRKLPKGVLLVLVVGADDQPLMPDALRLEVGPGRGGREWASSPVVHFDPEVKAWRADDVPAGAIEVRVSGDHVLETAQGFQQTFEGGEPLKVKVEAAGAVRWSVTLADGTVPAEVTLSLLDEKERPLKARFEARSASVLSSPRTATKVTLGPEGVVMGLKPGRYILRATSPTENTADTKVDVVAGETTELPITIRA